MGFKTSRIQWLSGLVCDNLYDCLTSDKEKKRKKSLTLAPLAFNTAAWRGPGRPGKWLVVRLKGKCKPTCGDLFPRVCRSYSNQQQSVFLSVVFTTPSPENSPGWATCSPPSAADLPNLCTQLQQADPTNTNTTATNTTTPTSLRWRNPISMVTHPPPPTKPSPRCVGGGISTPSAPPAVGGRRSYREATVSAPAARPSYPGGAAARSRRWSAELLSPPRWGNTPLWIPGSFCLRYTKINHTFFPFSLRLSLSLSPPLLFAPSFTGSFRCRNESRWGGKTKPNKREARPVGRQKPPHAGLLRAEKRRVVAVVVAALCGAQIVAAKRSKTGYLRKLLLPRLLLLFVVSTLSNRFPGPTKIIKK